MTATAEIASTSRPIKPVDRLATWRVPAWAGVLVIAALWLISRPYRGVRHDAVLYLGQALGRLMPDSIGRDLFLAYGSQDRYSVYSRIMAPLLQHWGAAGPEMMVLLLCQGAFILGCWGLTQNLSSRALRWCALLALVSLSHTYAGGSGSFAFAEPFLSARSIAEPLVLLSIAFVLRDRMVLAGLLMLGALAMHSLMALPALATLWVMLCLKDRRWCIAIVLPVLAAVSGAAGIAPFDALWRTFDPLWWTQVKSVNSAVFLASWVAQDWGTVAFDLVVVFLAARLLAGTPLARLLRALMICVPVLTLLWAVGADVLHDVLLTQLQLWRIFWLTHLFAVLLLPVPLASLWQRGPVGIWAASALMLAAIAVSANLSTQLLCVLWAVAPLLMLRFEVQVSHRIAFLAGGASVTAALMVSAMVAWRTHATVAAYPDRFNGTTDLQILLGVSALTAAAGYALLRGLASSGAWRPISITVLAITVVCAGAWWDQRSDWQRFVEGGLQETGLPFEGKVPPSATVYWDGSLVEPWLLMQRQQFYMNDQSSGLLFSRETAMHFAARQNTIRPLLIQREVCSTLAALTGHDTAGCGPTQEVLRAICDAPGAPDYMVFYANPDSDGTGAAAIWSFRPGDAVHGRTYRLYDCAHLR